MKKITLYMTALLMVSVSCSKMEIQEPDVHASDAVEIPASAYDGELLIKFAPEMSDILDHVQWAEGPATRSGIPSTDEVLSILGAYSFERIFPVDAATEEKTRKAGLHLWYTVKFDPDTDLQQAVSRLSELGEISSVQCNAEIHRSYRTDSKPFIVDGPALKTKAVAAGLPFADEYLPYQWNYINKGDLPFKKDWAPVKKGSDVGCEEAWKRCTGNPEIIVAVLDEGVLYTHPDLKDNMWVNEDDDDMFSGEDKDHNGYIGDKHGYNFVSDSPVISSDGSGNVGHGTHVAGTIAAANNGIGVCGIAGGSEGHPGVKIMSCQLFDGMRGASRSASAKAIKYAADNGAVILQCSWGYLSSESDQTMFPMPGPDSEEEWVAMAPLEKDAIDYFVENAGSPNGVIDGGIPIFASGNEYACYSSFPAAYSKCISVASIAADYTPAVYTNYGAEVDFSAPGGDNDYYAEPGSGRADSGDIASSVQMHGSILSTLSANGKPVYGYMEGTSMACPHVSGVAALGLSYALECHRHFTAEEFVALMKEAAEPLDPYYNDSLHPYKKYHFQAFTHDAPMSKLLLKSYSGRMGKLAKADRLLDLIAGGAGRDMVLPDIYVATKASKEINLTGYFKETGFSCSVKDQTVAKASVTGNILKVTGVSSGFTELTVKAGAKAQTVVITVRDHASDNGWL